MSEASASDSFRVNFFALQSTLLHCNSRLLLLRLNFVSFWLFSFCVDAWCEKTYSLFNEAFVEAAVSFLTSSKRKIVRKIINIFQTNKQALLQFVISIDMDVMCAHWTYPRVVHLGEELEDYLVIQIIPTQLLTQFRLQTIEIWYTYSDIKTVFWIWIARKGDCCVLSPWLFR